jgi:hypothetical protein
MGKYLGNPRRRLDDNFKIDLGGRGGLDVIWVVSVSNGELWY